jgi:hypothetical protein
LPNKWASDGQRCTSCWVNLASDYSQNWRFSIDVGLAYVSVPLDFKPRGDGNELEALAAGDVPGGRDRNRVKTVEAGHSPGQWRH